MAACKGKNSKGEPCQAAAPKGRKFCLFHDPDRVQEAQAARSKGGSKLEGAVPLFVGDPRSEEDLFEISSKALGMVARREMDNKTADTIIKLVKANLLVLKQRRATQPTVTDDDLARMSALEQVEEMERYCAEWRKEQASRAVKSPAVGETGSPGGAPGDEAG